MNPLHCTVSFGKEDIRFKVFFTDRKTMEIAVHPDKEIVIKAPIGTDPSAVQKRVLKRGAWIKRQLDYFRQFDPRTPRRHYVGGETHLYLGRQYRIKIILGKSNQVKLVGGFFWINIDGTKRVSQVKNLLDSWYAKMAAARFRDSLARCRLKFKKAPAGKPRVHIRRMSKRWGSLSKNGRLTLNVDLIRAPMECVDYVIAHELCHFRHPDHGPGFYRLLEHVMPDWEERKAKLEATLV